MRTRTAGLWKLTLELLDPCRSPRCSPRTAALVDLRLADPAAQRVRVDSQLTADPQQRARHGLAGLLVAVSNTSRTARWRRSAGYLRGAGIADSSPDGFGASINPGATHS